MFARKSYTAESAEHTQLNVIDDKNDNETSKSTW